MTDYTNKEIVDKANSIANKILTASRGNKFRGPFLSKMIDAMQLKNGVELGTDKGKFAQEIMNGSTLKTLCCIDCWLDDYCHVKEGGSRYKEAMSRLDSFIKSERVKIIHKYSVEAASDFADNSIDFIYIDSDHSLFGIAIDLMVWTPKVKIGGLISGHDYNDLNAETGMVGALGNPLPFRVKTVVDQFALRYGYSVRPFGRKVQNWWFVKNTEAPNPVKFLWQP